MVSPANPQPACRPAIRGDAPADMPIAYHRAAVAFRRPDDEAA
jgi:hypothetical protein